MHRSAFRRAEIGKGNRDMPKLTNIEEATLLSLKRKGDSLQNGKKGDLHTMSEVLGELASVVVAMARTGGISPDECDERHRIMKGRADEIQAEHMLAMKVLREEQKKAIEDAIQHAVLPPAWLVLARMGMVVVGSSGTVLGIAYMVFCK